MRNTVVAAGLVGDVVTKLWTCDTGGTKTVQSGVVAVVAELGSGESSNGSTKGVACYDEFIIGVRFGRPFNGTQDIISGVEP